MDILDIIARNLISIGVLFVLTRLMGRKQISHLTFFDYVVGISIGSVAASLAVDNTIQYSHGLTSLLTWAAFPIIFSYVSLKSTKARKVVDGTPNIIIQNGKIIEKNMRKAKINISDVLEELRLKGAYNIADVEYAVLETNGHISLLLKSQKQPVTPSDLNIPTEYKGLCANLIIDGRIIYDNLRFINRDESWLLGELREKNIASPGDVLLASLDTSGNLYIDLKDSDPPPLKVLD